MKRLLITLLTLILLLSLAACTDKEEQTATVPETAGASSATQETATQPKFDFSFENRTEDGAIVTPILPFN
ncbi:MAG: hypothetical protein IJC84_01780 [Clostridia bacterium]|nr:hypothetical protein [Clostridia bacterium]